MAEQQLDRCIEMATELSKTDQSESATIIMNVVNSSVADKKTPKSLIDFLVMNAHIMLFRLLKIAKKSIR